MATTAASAKTSSSKKVATSSTSQAELILIRDFTDQILRTYFPTLSRAPNALFVAMSTWGLESGFKIWPNKVNSMHFTGTSPSNSALVGTGYWYTPVIQNLLKSESTSTEVLQNIDQGRYPHGLSACMGCYHVKGTTNNTQEFRLRKDVIEAFGLEVNPGESITALFPNSDIGMQRSIASGLIILERKYLTYLKNNSPTDAIKKAVAAYVGRLGVKDANGYTPEDRVRQVYSGENQSISQKLASVGVVADSGSTSYASVTNNIINNSMVLKGTAENSTTRTASPTTQASPASLPGC